MLGMVRKRAMGDGTAEVHLGERVRVQGSKSGG